MADDTPYLIKLMDGLFGKTPKDDMLSNVSYIPKDSYTTKDLQEYYTSNNWQGLRDALKYLKATGTPEPGKYDLGYSITNDPNIMNVLRTLMGTR